MKFPTEAFGEIEFKNVGDGCYEAQVELAGKPVSVVLSWELGDESDSLSQALESVAKELPTLFESGRAALAADLANDEAEFGVAMYAEHHTEELEEDVLAATVGNATPTAQDFLAHLHPYILRVDPEDADGRYTLDYGIGRDLTDYLVCVRLDAQRRVSDVVVES